jgi:hypothetical protein
VKKTRSQPYQHVCILPGGCSIASKEFSKFHLAHVKIHYPIGW